ncbi:hypothetical protein [Paracoccus luteus]|uniref:hypothetical protein n=1 Tax=Paracoccus luteus TaxID=2508543 RepID=UPI00106FBB6F|nr:hypothetical protein [Paracoccus luteus]
MILILSAPDDLHARAVIDRLDRRGAAARILDPSQFPQAARLALRYGGNRSHLGYGDDSGAVIDLDRVRAAWWRRPAPCGVPGRGAATVAAARCDDAVAGLWLAMDAQWMNPPLQDAAARRDSWQLRLAADLGLDPPQTLITNCPQTARAFAEQIGDVVCKRLAGQARAGGRRTRRLRAAAWRRLDGLNHAPAILQERIAGRDVRVTVIGTRAFAAEAAAGGGPDAPMQSAALPEPVETAIHAMMARLGLIHAALRFRRATDGALRFLDIDPAGPWLPVEEQTGQPIAQAVADHLAGMAP